MAFEIFQSTHPRPESASVAAQQATQLGGGIPNKGKAFTKRKLRRLERSDDPGGRIRISPIKSGYARLLKDIRSRYEGNYSHSADVSITFQIVLANQTAETSQDSVSVNKNLKTFCYSLSIKPMYPRQEHQRFLYVESPLGIDCNPGHVQVFVYHRVGYNYR